MKGRISRFGLTLVELLVVVGLISLLAATTLPTVKTLLEDRKSNQAGIQLRNVLEAAKAKAAGRNRSVAVVLERMDDSLDNNNADAKYLHQNTVLRVSIAEVLPPYRGDIDNATTLLQMNNGNVNTASFNLAQNPSIQLFAVPGSTISFEDRSERYEIISASQAAQVWIVVFANFPNNAAVSAMPSQPYVNLPVGQHRFRVYSVPRRLFNKPIEFPKGICVDLTLSGMGQSGAQFASDIIAANDQTILANPNMPLAPRYFKPIYIVFNPRGQVTELLENDRGAINNGVIAARYRRVVPNGPIYLFIGRVDQVTNPRLGVPSEFVQNLSDEKNYWLRIVPETGQISLAPSLDPIAALVPDPLAYSRQLATFGNDLSGR